MKTEEVTVKGALLSFDDFALCPEVREAIGALGFKDPTPIQTETYPHVMAGVDIIAMAQTGTGKTAAFAIPIAEKLDPSMRQVQALILTPTRELALQVSREMNAIGEKRGLRCAAIYGGASFTNQTVEIKEGAQVVAGTPGRVLDHLRRRTISFSSVKIMVLDEADEMLSMGFEKEISEIMEAVPKTRQNLLFSATIPDDIRRLTKRYMGEALVISVSGDDIATAQVSHFVYLVSGHGRQRDLVRVLETERPESALIFCNTKEETQTLSRHLQNNGYNADWLNSDLSQSERERVMANTRSGKLRYLVATDVAARGIDVSQLSHVINYTFPESLDVYVHRTGRTGRMGRFGTAISLIAPQDIGNLYFLRLTYNIHPVERTLPDEASLKRSLELDRLAKLRSAFKERGSGEFLDLAQRLMKDVHAERILAGLLAAYFKEDVENRAQSARDDREDDQPEDAFTDDQKREIYVDAGRKDGLRISMLMREIERLTSLPRSAIGKVRMLTRSTFIAVPEEHFDKIIKAVNQIEFEGRRLVAEAEDPS